VVALALVPALLTVFAYWPGLMNWDPVRQYGEALSGQITDWHPPIMQWLWRRFIPHWPGPAPMLLVQVALWWGGLALLAARARAAKRARLGWALLACGLLPVGLALTGAIYKDCMMAGALASAAGLAAWRKGRAAWLVLPLAAGLLLFASALRFNGFAATMPLAVALLPAALRRTRLRLLLTAAVTSGLLLATVPLINAASGAKPSGVQLSLMIFDLGGITEHSGVDVFPRELDKDLDDKPIVDPVAVNHHCYNPLRWDSYSDWVDVECPLGFTDWNNEVAPKGVDAKRVWLAAVLHHPLAYAEHRLTHFAYNTRLLPLTDAQERAVPRQDAPNDWHFHVTPGPVLNAIDALAMASSHTPLGWPIVLIALAFGGVVAAPGAPRRSRDADGLGSLALPLALSSFLYGMSYLVFSVASELRYHLWTTLAALLATVLVAANRPPPGRLALAYLPAITVTIATIALRL
jgi:hypothetical protein